MVEHDEHEIHTEVEGGI